jgi:bZIP transcription factor
MISNISANENPKDASRRQAMTDDPSMPPSAANAGGSHMRSQNLGGSSNRSHRSRSTAGSSDEDDDDDDVSSASDTDKPSNRSNRRQRDWNTSSSAGETNSKGGDVVMGGNSEKSMDSLGSDPAFPMTDQLTRLRRAKRLEMNRESARARRKRKKALIDTLEKHVTDLTQKNRRLVAINTALTDNSRSLEMELQNARQTIKKLHAALGINTSSVGTPTGLNTGSVMLGHMDADEGPGGLLSMSGSSAHWNCNSSVSTAGSSVATGTSTGTHSRGKPPGLPNLVRSTSNTDIQLLIAKVQQQQQVQKMQQRKSMQQQQQIHQAMAAVTTATRQASLSSPSGRGQHRGLNLNNSDLVRIRVVFRNITAWVGLYLNSYLVWFQPSPFSHWNRSLQC